MESQPDEQPSGSLTDETRRKLEGFTNQDLLELLQKNDREKWSEAEMAYIRQLLQSRLNTVLVCGSESEKPLAAEPEPEMNGKKNSILFAVGFLGWYLVNGFVWFMLAPSGSVNGGQYGPIPNIIILPVNAIVLLILAIIRQTRQIALGILSAMVLNFFISLFFGMAYNGQCFIPFFIK